MLVHVPEQVDKFDPVPRGYTVVHHECGTAVQIAWVLRVVKTGHPPSQPWIGDDCCQYLDQGFLISRRSSFLPLRHVQQKSRLANEISHARAPAREPPSVGFRSSAAP